jgi:toxin HigB-1
MRFADVLTEAVFNGNCPKGLPSSIVETARRKVAMIDAAYELKDLRSPPGNRLHLLKNDELASMRSGFDPTLATA